MKQIKFEDKEVNGFKFMSKLKHYGLSWDMIIKIERKGKFLIVEIE